LNIKWWRAIGFCFSPEHQAVNPRQTFSGRNARIPYSTPEYGLNPESQLHV
jgi:hypothetical protein